MVISSNGNGKGNEYKQRKNDATNKDKNKNNLNQFNGATNNSIYDNSSLLSKYTYAYLWPLNAKVRKLRRTTIGGCSALRSEDFDNYAPGSCCLGSSSSKSKNRNKWRTSSSDSHDEHQQEIDCRGKERDRLYREWETELGLQHNHRKKQADETNDFHHKSNGSGHYEEHDEQQQKQEGHQTAKKIKEEGRKISGTDGRQASRANLFRAILRAYKVPFLITVAFILLSDCILEPAYFFLSVTLIELIGQFPSGKITTTADSDAAKLERGVVIATTVAPPPFNSTMNSANTTYDTQQQQQQREELVDELLLPLPLLQPPTAGQLYLTATLFCICISSYQLLTHPFQWWAAKLTLKLRVSLSEMIYDKALRIDKLRAASEHQVNFRQAVNLISRDLESLEGNIQQLAWVVSAPLQCIVVTWIVGQHLDLPTAMIAFVINISVACQRSYTSVRVRRYSHRASQVADTRVNLISEALDAIRLVRMYAWTRPMEAQIDSARLEEMANRSRVVLMNSIDQALFFITCSASAILSLIFGHYVRGLPINQSMVSQVFLISAFYRRLMTRQFPQAILSWMNILVVVDRCERYLSARDHEDKRHQMIDNNLGNNNNNEQKQHSAAAAAAAAVSSSQPRGAHF